jgi:hypothetical protein
MTLRPNGITKPLGDYTGVVKLLLDAGSDIPPPAMLCFQSNFSGVMGRSRTRL